MQTWYVLKDGTYADPNECGPDDDGVLRHKNGMEVAIGSHGNPMSRSMSEDDMTSAKAPKKAKDQDSDKAKGKTREATAESDGPSYKTREVKKG